MNKQKFLKSVFIAWIALWVFFLIREDKDGQYKMMGYLYAHSGEDNARYITGEKLYDFILFCKDNILPGSTYELAGFEKFSIDEVRARYYLWPLVSDADEPDFRIVYGGEVKPARGYKMYMRYGDDGYVAVRKDREK
ncbi:MAG: hypothetical protein PVH45_01655 [Candidatus Omnitrophota bacterium]